MLYLLARDAYWVGYFNDDAFYLIGARALTEGRFAELNHPGQPPLIQYLPGYPLLLAPLMPFCAASWLPAQLLSVLVGLSSAAAAAWAFAPDLDEEGRLLLAALCLFNPLALSLSGAVLADAPFALAALLLVGTARRAWPRTSPRVWAALGAAAGASALIRPNGLALILALAAALAWERRGREAAAALAAAALVVGPWFLRNAAAGGHPLLYAAELAGPIEAAPWTTLGAAASRAGFYLSELYARALFRWPWGAPPAAAAAAAALAGLAAAVLALTRGGLSGGRRFALLSALALFGLLLAWDKRSTRYLLPLIPLAAAWGLAGLAGRRGTRLAAAALALASFIVPARAILAASLRPEAPPARAPERTFAWIRANTAPGAVFACELDGQLFLRTGRRSVTLPRGADGRNLQLWAAGSGADFLLVSPTADILRTTRGVGPHDAVPAAERRRDAGRASVLEPVFEDPGEGTVIYTKKTPGL